VSSSPFEDNILAPCKDTDVREEALTTFLFQEQAEFWPACLPLERTNRPWFVSIYHFVRILDRRENVNSLRLPLLLVYLWTMNQGPVSPGKGTFEKTDYPFFLGSADGLALW
jgi:hypothetical protein